MITWLAMFLQKIEGANLFLVVVGVMWVLYAGFFLAVKANRSKKNIKTAAIAGVAITLICDIVWFIKFFDNLEYRNPGISGIAWLVLLPILMFLAIMVLSYINASRYEFDKKKREKEEEKRKKQQKRKKQLEKEAKNTENSENH